MNDEMLKMVHGRDALLARFVEDGLDRQHHVAHMARRHGAVRAALEREREHVRGRVLAAVAAVERLHQRVVRQHDAGFRALRAPAEGMGRERGRSVADRHIVRGERAPVAGFIEDRDREAFGWLGLGWRRLNG